MPSRTRVNTCRTRCQPPRDSEPGADESRSCLQTSIAAFGTPAEIALAYREVERRHTVRRGEPV